MKKIIRDFIPPVILQVLGNAFNNLKVSGSHRIFSSYEEALQSCTPDAYEQQELIEVIFKKTKRFSENIQSGILPIPATTAYSLLSIINPIIQNNTGVINVVDFGGACGAHFFYFRNLIDKRLKLNWAVVETPAMVKAAKQLGTEELHFFDNLADAVMGMDDIDLFHTSGTLQAVNNPDKYLRNILNCNAKWLLFNRLGVNKNDRDIITIHQSKLSWNGMGNLPEGYTDRWIRYPFTFQSEKAFLENVENKYSIIAKFSDQSGMYPVRGEQIDGYGLLCKQKIPGR